MKKIGGGEFRHTDLPRTKTMFCSECGAKNQDENNFCRQCGRKLIATASAKINEEAFERALPEEEQKTALLEHAYDRKQAGDLQGAIVLSEEALKLYPQSTEAHSLLGQLHEADGSRELAIKHYEKVVDLNPGSIADRMKLDLLRNDLKPSINMPASKVLMIPHDTPRSSKLPAAAGTAAGIGLIALLCGLLINMQKNLNDTQKETSRVKSEKDAAQIAENLKIANGRVALNPLLSDVRAIVQPPQKTTVGPPLAKNENASSPGFLNPAGSSPSSQIQPFQTQRFPLNGGPPANFPFAQSAAQLPQNTAKPILKPKPAAKPVNSDDEEGSGKIRLTVNGVKGGDDAATIKISPKSLQNSSADGANAADDKRPGSIKVTKRPSSESTVSEGEGASSESKKMIAIGEEKMNQGLYSDAIAAFRKATEGANDELGYLYSRLGKCYETKGDNRNALSFYEKGIDEYSRMLKTGIQKERAKDGLRVCENGKKICSVE